VPQLARRDATVAALVQRRETCVELAQLEGLGEVVVGAGVEALELLLKCVARGEDQDGRVAAGVLA